MYVIDANDEVVALADVPRSDVGSPRPVVLAAEGHLLVAFYLQDQGTDWDGPTVRTDGSGSSGEPVALVRFERPYATLFGPPNDEAFSGHPLAGRGLQPYGAFEVRRSSWIRQLAKMNVVHPHHREESFATLRHFVLSFHDSTFECVAHAYRVTTATGTAHERVAQAAQDLAR